MKEIKNIRSSSGFIQLELLLLLSLLGYSTTLLMPALSGWQEGLYYAQLRAAAQLVAGDLRDLQAYIMFKHGTNRLKLIPDSDQQGYSISYGTPPYLAHTSFDKSLCGEVYFDNYLKMGFSSTGSPTVTGSLILKHHKLSYRSLRIELQPVTGRVLLHEE